MNEARSHSPAAPDRADFAAAAAELLDLVRHLSGPDGCPWDKEQTPRTLSPYVVEESHEVGDAIAAGDRAASAEELGDLLFLACFLAVTLEREGGASPAAVLRGNIAKMIARHPHVFGGSGRADLDSRGVLRQWEEGKRRETGATSLLGERPQGLPALLQAYRIQEKAASVGFDWPDVQGVIAKLREELDEVEREIAAADEERLAEELGDLLFAVVNLARFVKTDPEARLRLANEKFRRRFDRVAGMLRAEGRSPNEAGLPELDRLWEAAKREERACGDATEDDRG
ncbi:MAG TPA: nucleoside triphosphate pyrophosphohydrolase [Candidatus Eisenbacteria bacterium]|nr:nucleoside triphosphate pyrophosphohydrolase [Candidatus Eisenbacteria bacterium]